MGHELPISWKISISLPGLGDLLGMARFLGPGTTPKLKVSFCSVVTLFTGKQLLAECEARDVCGPSDVRGVLGAEC
ncbi:hypothetical protein E2C01_025132 [Portunus trituberculatus]|uniref:Uncharacterized protein n=1 Tax=Portunus trituberculatus TaxID=210409 RepID=A0A5B7ECC3_PORTR|nr:hypothetical protein [Portunus trituberculatus]